MKRIFIWLVILAAMMFLLACGASAPASTQALAPSTSTEVPVQPAVTNPPAQVDLTQTAPASSTATQVNVTLADNTIKSSLTTFKVGVPYTFIIQNSGQHAHDFNISTPVSIAGSLDAALAGALLVVTRDQLISGMTATVNFTFPDSAADQPLEFSCLIPRHYQDGMLLAITVTK